MKSEIDSCHDAAIAKNILDQVEANYESARIAYSKINLAYVRRILQDVAASKIDLEHAMAFCPTRARK